MVGFFCFLITNYTFYLNVNTNIPYQQILTCRAINPKVILHFTLSNLNSLTVLVFFNGQFC